MRYASVCSGVEAASLAWMPLGWEAVFFAEIEPFPCAVLKERFPDVPNLGDMTEIKGEKYHGTVDLLVGGTPCQGFSVAGKQGGLNDSRSALCLAYCGLLETMRPRWFVWENVPGVFSTNQGDDFRAFLSKIDEIGYSCAWRVLDAQYVRVDGFPRAVPQRRRRVFVVGHLGGDWRYPASVLFEPGCLPGDTPPRRVKGAGVARSLTASTGGASGKEQQHTFISGDGRLLNALGVDGYNGAISGKVSATVDTNCKNVDGPTLVMEKRRENGLVMGAKFWNGEDVSTTLTEAFADDRMPDKGKLPCVICRAGDMANAETGVNVGTTLLARQYKSPPFVCAHETGQGYWQDGDIAGTLRAEGENRPSRPSNIICAGFSDGQGDKASRIGYEDEVAPTIRSAESWSTQVPDVVCHENHDAPLAFRWAASPSQGLPIGVDYCHTLMANQNGEPAVCYENHAQDSRIKPCGEYSPQINAKAGTGGCNLPHATGVMGVSVNTSVRRLLPVECERLMGFPDNWTRIPWRGKSAEDCPDSPRYKACGNSMCVNVMRWIGLRIEKVERRMKGIDNEKARP